MHKVYTINYSEVRSPGTVVRSPESNPGFLLYFRISLDPANLIQVINWIQMAAFCSGPGLYILSALMDWTPHVLICNQATRPGNQAYALSTSLHKGPGVKHPFRTVFSWDRKSVGLGLCTSASMFSRYYILFTYIYAYILHV